ncbi:MAG: glycosyltransferase [Clostridia bacterium]
MKIVVNNIAASSGGALSVLQDFYNYIKDNDRKNEWIFLLSDNFIEETDNIKVIIRDDIKKSKFRKLAFDLVFGRNFINRMNADVVFSMQNIITFGVKAPQVVYIHQPVPFQKLKKFSFLIKKERQMAIYQYLIGIIIKKSAKKANKIIVQTKWMKDEVQKQCRVNGVVNILPSIEDLRALKNFDDYSTREFFYPSADIIYKNNDLIEQACKILNRKGCKDFGVEITIENKKDTDNIKYLGRIDRKEVISKYNTKTLIFPSYIETFGYPLAEARQMGSIILASDCDFSREVLEGYENAYFFNPFDQYSLADLMEKVIEGEIAKKDELYETLAYSNNTWSEVYDEVLSI